MDAGSRLRHVARDEDGAILVFVAIALAVLLGLVALSFDFGRLASTQAELQSYADNVALAAAGELDGRSDSITRARAAAASLITDSQTFAEGDRILSGQSEYTIDFFSSLPAADTLSMAGATTDPAEAIFVRVRVTPRQVEWTFAAALFALTGNTPAANTVSASAVAGFTQYACDITPLMFCIPSQGFKADQNVGRMIRLRSGGNGAAWGPGDFGFLDPAKIAVDTRGPCAGLTGNRLDACLSGAEGSITQCFALRGVDTEPGQKVGIEDAVFNVRFDIYRSVMNGNRSDIAYRPAPNVIKGIVRQGGGGGGNACIGANAAPSPNTAALPRDTCFNTGTCARYGDGNWAAGRATYVATNYGGADPHPSASTRWDYYLAEIAAAGGGSATTRILPAGRAETGRPMCSPHQSPDPERRVVIAAAIDCVANPVNGREEDVPVEEFVRMFLTEPVGSDGTSPPRLDLWVEILGSAGGTGSGSGNPSGIFRDVVQLYR